MIQDINVLILMAAMNVKISTNVRMTTFVFTHSNVETFLVLLTVLIRVSILYVSRVLSRLLMAECAHAMSKFHVSTVLTVKLGHDVTIQNVFNETNVFQQHVQVAMNVSKTMAV